MLDKIILAFGVLLAAASADVAPGFPIPAPARLDVSYGGNAVSPPGELIPRPDTASPPNISTPSFPSSPGVLLMVDLDVARNGTRVQLLHWLSTNVSLANSLSTASPHPLIIPNSPVPYLQPSPPAGDSPHAYTWILFPQPANFFIPAQYANLTNNRVPFNVSKFVMDTGLGQAIAGNYIRVQNLTGTATTTYPPERTTAVGNETASIVRPTATVNATDRPVEYPGVAAPVLGGKVFWVGVSTALLAGVATLVL